MKGNDGSVWYARLIALIGISRHSEEMEDSPRRICCFVKWYEEIGIDERSGFRQLKWCTSSPFDVINVASVNRRVHLTRDGNSQDRFLVNTHVDTMHDG